MMVICLLNDKAFKIPEFPTYQKAYPDISVEDNFRASVAGHIVLALQLQLRGLFLLV
ncbi:hypothetical protein BH09BAC1_BH09BAC1_23940 [soil metagenome]